jgi:hypothetical protein
MQQLWRLPGAARSSWRLPGLQHATLLRGLFIHLSGCHQRHTGRGVACSCTYPQPELSSCVAHAFRGIMRPRFWHMQAMSFAAPQLEKAAPAVLWHGYLVPWDEEQPGKQTSSPPATRFGELTGAHLTDLGDPTADASGVTCIATVTSTSNTRAIAAHMPLILLLLARGRHSLVQPSRV